MGYKKTIIVGFFLFGLVVIAAFTAFYASLGEFECKVLNSILSDD